MDIADRIWARWQELDAAKCIDLRLVSNVRPREAVAALRTSVNENADAWYAAVKDEESPLPGIWAMMEIPNGVYFTVTEAPNFRQELERVTELLEQRGITGTVDLYDPPLGQWPPARADLLECRVRIRGKRRPGDAPPEHAAYHWDPDPVAVRAFMAVAEDWVRRLPGPATFSLGTPFIGPVRLVQDEPVAERMQWFFVEEAAQSAFSASSAEDWRLVVARPPWGSCSLIVAGPRVRAGWQREVEAFVDVLREHADLFVYAYVRRGVDVRRAVVGSEFSDLPERPNCRPYGAGGTPEAFEDVYAPDGYGIQLLGPGYDGRIPTEIRWHAERVGAGSTLLRHADAASWFADSPVSGAGTGALPAPSPVLRQAREDLAPILYTPGTLSRDGHAAASQSI